MKHKKLLSTIASYIIVISLSVFPINSNRTAQTNCILLPPLCFVREMYDTDNCQEEVCPDDIFNNDKNIKIEVKFKLFEIVGNFFEKIFS